MDKTDLEELLGTMVRSGATSLHLHPGHTPWVRVQGNIVTSRQQAPTAEAIEELTRDFLFADHRDRLQKQGEVEVLYAARSGIRFRVTVMLQEQGCGIVFRRVSSEAPTFEVLNLPELLAGFTTFQSGIVMVAGFFGSGKSTTAAAMVERINRESARHIVTVEEPIEFLFPHDKSLLHQREVGTHVDATATGVEQAVRQGAEVIMVGEIQDWETMDACLNASEQGCLVISTVDASSVVGGLTRLMNQYPIDRRGRARARIAKAMRVVIGQMLLQRAHQKGRVPLLEILINNRSVRKAIRTGDLSSIQKIMKAGRGLGMQTVDGALRNLLSRHLITWEEALFHAVDREWLQARVSMQS